MSPIQKICFFNGMLYYTATALVRAFASERDRETGGANKKPPVRPYRTRLRPDFFSRIDPGRRMSTIEQADRPPADRPAVLPMGDHAAHRS